MNSELGENGILMGLRLLSTSVVQNNVVTFVCLPGGDEVVVVWFVVNLQNKGKGKEKLFYKARIKSNSKSTNVGGPFTKA